jgi:hypothetical protein
MFLLLSKNFTVKTNVQIVLELKIENIICGCAEVGEYWFFLSHSREFG